METLGSATSAPRLDNEMLLTIGEVASRFGVTLRALRFYKDRSLIAPRRIGATRLYDGPTLKRLELILRGKKLGFTLSEIRQMVAQRAPESGGQEFELAMAPNQVLAQIELLRQQREGIELAINELEATRQRMQGDVFVGAATPAAANHAA